MTLKNKKKLAVFCGARFPKLEANELIDFKSEIQKLSESLSQKYNLIYGGGQVGIMGLVADEFLKHNAHVTGVIPQYLNTVEIQHLGVSDTQVVDDLHQRKAMMETMADVFLVLPGGIGTLDELCEVLTLQTLNRHKNKIYIWNWNNVFKGFVDFIQNGIQVGFISEDLLSNCVITENQDEILKKLL